MFCCGRWSDFSVPAASVFVVSFSVCALVSLCAGVFLGVFFVVFCFGSLGLLLLSPWLGACHLANKVCCSKKKNID